MTIDPSDVQIERVTTNHKSSARRAVHKPSGSYTEHDGRVLDDDAAKAKLANELNRVAAALRP